MQSGNLCGTYSAAQGSQVCHCEAPKGPWRPEREARGSALGVQSREGSCDFADDFPVVRSGSARLPRRFAPRNDKSGGIVRSAKPLYNLPARKALTERRYRRNRFSRFYRQPVRIGSIAPGGVYPSPTIIYDFPYSLSYGCISRNSPGVRPVSLRNALAKAVEDGKPHSAEMCRTVSSVPRSRTLAFASRRRTMRA